MWVDERISEELGSEDYNLRGYAQKAALPLRKPHDEGSGRGTEYSIAAPCLGSPKPSGSAGNPSPNIIKMVRPSAPDNNSI